MANQFPGDFALKEVNLYSMNESQKIDIKPLVLQIDLYESIFSSSIQATISIQDIGQNLISSLPIIGQERIEIIMTTDSSYYTLNYYIYSIDSRSMKEKNQVYVMHCVSIEALRNENFRVCERIDNIKSEKIIENVLRTNAFSTKPLEIDKTVFPFDMYVPNWRPFDLFNWLSTRSIPEFKKDSIGFLFFETLEGFKFKSIDTLLNKKIYPTEKITYTYFQGNTAAIAVDDNDRYRIMNYNSPKAFNIYDDLRRGAFAHNCIYLDVNRATYRVFKSTADEFWNQSEHLGKLKPYSSGGPAQLLSRGSRSIYRPSTISTWGAWDDEIEDVGKENIDEVNKNFEKAFYRYYFMEYNQLDIAVPGDLRNRAGNIINVSIPSPKKSSNNKVVQDERMSGKYLVSAVKHSILNRSELRTFITLCRDSYGGKSLPDDFYKGGQINLDGTN